jgi:hypothetical protein
MMTWGDLQKLIAKRAELAAQWKRDAAKLPQRKRKAALDRAEDLQSAVDIACSILGEPDTTEREAEERIKALFVHVICA